MTATTATDYTPLPTSLPGKVCAYMGSRADIPAMDADDIADRFGVQQAGVHTQLAKAVEAGLLKRNESSHSGILYTATPKLRRAVEGQNARAEREAKTASSAGAANAKRPARQLVDLLALPIEADVPLPSGPTTTRFDYAAVLDRLSKKGQSFVVPGNAMGLHPLRKVITERNKAGKHHYVVRTDPSGALRVWRTA